MNERIQALAEQARIKDHWSIDEARYLTNYLDEKKFAELIIAEYLLPRKPLSDEQISAIGSKIFPSTWNIRHIEFARAIEAAHGIGE